MSYKILDATCGYRGIWYQKNHPLVTWMDARKGKFISYQNPKDKRIYRVNPDVVSEWKDAPFEKETFDMIVFDPPHLVRKRETKESRMMIQYGYLYEKNYKQVLKEGIKKLFDVLKQEGVFIFKWDETDKSINEILPLFPFKPLFSNKTINHNPKKKDSYMVVFLKYDVNKKLKCCHHVEK